MVGPTVEMILLSAVPINWKVKADTGNIITRSVHIVLLINRCLPFDNECV